MRKNNTSNHKEKSFFKKNYGGLIFLSFINISSTLFCQTTRFDGGLICQFEAWNLVWEDNFDSDSLDKSKWTTWFPYTDTGNDQCEFCRTHGKEGQIYRDENVLVKNGILKLKAEVKVGEWFGQYRNYSSGMIHSRKSFMYGRFDLMGKIPEGMGFWPAFWLFGGNGTEIDIFEFGGQSPTHHHFGIIHWEGKSNTKLGFSNKGENYSENFHLFSVIWDPFFIEYFVDNQLRGRISRFLTLSGNPIFDCCLNSGIYLEEPSFPQGENNFVNVIANLAIGTLGGPFTDAPNQNTLLPNYFEIDFIKVYDREPPTNRLDSCFVKAYPNPTTDFITISGYKLKSITIFNLFGKELASFNITRDQNILNLSFLPNGIYLAKIENEMGVFCKRIIKLSEE